MSTPVHAAEQLSDLPVTPGQVLEGKFRIERIIGEGAMGLVVEARHLRLDERVALKFLRREARARPDIVARFSREARAAAKIRSDHVARVYDVGSTNETTFIVMEYLEGIDLETQIAKGGITVGQGVEFVIQACEGLASAHSQGIVHRDIKPANLFITDNGGIPEVKVLDFGISKAGISSGSSVDDIDVASGDTREIMGSPYYMSPEQIRSTKDVDGRADLWSLGVVLYEILTGRPPIIATEVTAIIAQVLHDPHPPLASLRADLPDGLITIVDRCLAKDPERRFQSAADLAVALLPFGPKRAREVVERAVAIESRASGNAFQGDSLPPSAPRSSLSARRTGDLALANTVPAGRPAAQPKAGNPLFAWLAFGAVVLGLAGGAYAFVTRIRQGPPPTAEASSPPASTSAIPTPSLLSPASASGATATAIATGSASGSPAGAGADAATMASPAATFRPLPAPRPRATPALSPASSPAPAATQESEIRHER